MYKRVVFSALLDKNNHSNLHNYFMNEYKSRGYKNKEKYDQLLKNLEAMTQEDYKNWYNSFRNLDVKIVSSSIDFITEISYNPENYPLIGQMKDIYSRYKSLIDRSINSSVNGTRVVHEKEKMIKELNEVIDSVINSDEEALGIIDIILDQFKKELENEYLRKYTIELLRNTNKDLLIEAKGRLNKIGYIDEAITYKELNVIIALDNYKFQKKQNLGPFKSSSIGER